jgi:hypothetical protein
MKPISDEDPKDPPSTGSIQDAAYYHSSRDNLPSSPEEEFFTGIIDDIASKGRRISVRQPPRKSRTGRDPSIVLPTCNSICNDLTSETTEEVESVQKARRKSKSPAKIARQNLRTHSVSSANEMSDDVKTDRRSAISTSKQPSKKQSTKGLQSINRIGNFQNTHRSTMPVSKRASKESFRLGESREHSISTESSEFQIMSLNTKQPSKRSLESNPEATNNDWGQFEQEIDKVESDTSISLKRSNLEVLVTAIMPDVDEDSNFDDDALAFSSDLKTNRSSASASMKNIDDYISSLPNENVNPDGLRSSILRQSRITSKIVTSTMPHTPNETNSRYGARASPPKKFSPFNSKEDHKEAVAAALKAAGSMPFMPFESRRRSQGSNMSSNHSPGTSDNEEDSGVETVNTDSDYNSFVKKASLRSFECNEDRTGHQLSKEKDTEKSRRQGDFLDFVYRPLSGQNLKESFSRRQILSYFEGAGPAPMETIRVNANDSLVSEPTIDNSIRTANRASAPRQSDEIDETVRAALDRASEVRNSKRMSIGKISVEGQGNVKDVNDIVAAALKAASEARGISNSFNATSKSASRQQRKKSLSSNFSLDAMEQILSTVSPSAISKMYGGSESKFSVYGDSHTESGSYAHC